MHFFSKNIRIYAIFNDQSFNDTLINVVISFEQLGPDLNLHTPHMPQRHFFFQTECHRNNVFSLSIRAF